MMVDNITHEYLETLISEVKTDLLKAVWRHLRPPPYTNGHVAIRVLGKLSGRCRVPVILSNPLVNVYFFLLFPSPIFLLSYAIAKRRDCVRRIQYCDKF